MSYLEYIKTLSRPPQIPDEEWKFYNLTGFNPYETKQNELSKMYENIFLSRPISHTEQFISDFYPQVATHKPIYISPSGHYSLRPSMITYPKKQIKPGLKIKKKPKNI